MLLSILLKGIVSLYMKFPNYKKKQTKSKTNTKSPKLQNHYKQKQYMFYRKYSLQTSFSKVL